MTRPQAQFHPDSYPLGQYENAIRTLTHSSKNLRAQHQAVLSLARLGATEYALSEYDRYGLDSVDDDEDIIALKARLYKDLYIQADGDVATEYAGKSAAQYHKAFLATGGYYSGINAATMGVLSGKTDSFSRNICEALLEKLPTSTQIDREDYYFVMATRAEVHLLQGDDIRAERALTKAFTYDPLNYAAHATTLKQFALITNYQKREVAWLERFSAPATLHFAGHIWDDTSTLDERETRTVLSDHLQKLDIGFSYGALAAGADILAAEACLEEGVALHVILPLDEAKFEKLCVRPFGKGWVKRYRNCLECAHSVDVIPLKYMGLSDSECFFLGAQIAMGRAILRARDYGRSPHQILILDHKRKGSQTYVTGQSWVEAGFDQTLVPIMLGALEKSDASALNPVIHLEIARGGSVESLAIERSELSSTLKTVVNSDGGGNVSCRLATDQTNGPDIPASGQTFICDNLAALVLLDGWPISTLTYAGLTGGDDPVHWYSVQR